MGAYALKIMRPTIETQMAKTSSLATADCNCLVARQAASYITQFYDQYLAEAGLRTTQYGILAKLKRHGPMSISALAAELVMDRTTLGRNAQPLDHGGCQERAASWMRRAQVQKLVGLEALRRGDHLPCAAAYIGKDVEA